jgi:hypothetical protein
MLSVPLDDRASDPRFGEIRHPKKRAYLVALSHQWNFSRAALTAGVDRDTGLAWRRDKTARGRPMQDVKFQAALVRAGEMFVERAEAEMWRRGIEGVEKPVYQGGRMVGTVREYDTTAAIFMLKGAKPEKYRERMEHTGAGGGPVQLQAVPWDLSKLSDEQLDQLDQMRRRALAQRGSDPSGA